MTIYITAKQIKKRGNMVAPAAYMLSSTPQTLHQLIEVLVLDSVAGYNRRLLESEGKVLEKDEIDAMANVGRIGFGIPFGTRPADTEEAVKTALQGFEDGLYRVFIGDREIEALDTPLGLQEGDTVTIIRLVMLTGGYF